ncbi:MAG: DUF1257 domain-containing protein [candidate division WOR-3 bacterium]
MSIVCIIVPVVVGGWPVFSSLAAAAAAGLGFKLMKKTEVKRVEKKTINEIELADEKSEVIEESLKPEEELVFTREGITVTFKKDVRGKFTICVSGENKTNEELNKVGRLFLNKIKQQYAYQKVKQELTKKGYTLVQETAEGGRIKLLLRRF